MVVDLGEMFYSKIGINLIGGVLVFLVKTD
jgi:hypothetical protein